MIGPAAGPAVAAFVLSASAMIAAITLWAVGADEPFTPDIVLYPLAYLCLAGVGTMILSRRPGNRVGGLSLLAGLLGSVAALADGYARLSPPAPGQGWAVLVSAFTFPATLGPIAGVLLVFPNGRLASRAWTPVAWLVVIGVGLVAIGSALSPTFVDFPTIRNPIGMPWVTGTVLDQGGIGWLLLLLGVVSAAMGLVARLRGSRGIERQQLKLVTFAAALNGLCWLVVAFDLPGAAGDVAAYAVFATFATIPIAIGVAMLRYRLYDFDLVIRRTLVYGVLSATLAAVYIGSVIVLQGALSGFTGGGSLAVAASTLAVAALFGPVRRRVQAAVDRRFYRSRYDAARTVQGFSARLRDELDLDSLTDELRAVVEHTMRPSSVSVWLRRGGLE